MARRRGRSSARYADELIEYSYDSAGRNRAVDYELEPSDQPLFNASTIDAFGRVRQASHGAATYSGTYADTGRRLVQQASVTSALGSRTINFQGFDPMFREKSRSENRDGTVTTATVTYDALGRVASTARTTGSITQNEQFSYDALGNVLSLSANTNGHAGTSTQLTYATDDRDRICGIAYSGGAPSGCNVSYNEVGDIMQQPTRNAGTRHLSYFIGGAVRSVTDDHSSAQYLYDAFGNVADLQLSSDVSTDSRHDRRFGELLDWREPISGEGPEFAYLIRKIPGPSGIVASRRGNGGPWVFEFGEARGNRFFTDENGAFVQDVDYTAYGAALPTGTGAAPAGNVKYSNAQWNGGDSLQGLGVDQLGARLYDPAIGRFLSRDPLFIPRTAATTNPYAFAMNDPVNSSDPSGLDSCPEGHCPDTPIGPAAALRCALDPLGCTKSAVSTLDRVASPVIDPLADTVSDVGDVIDDIFSSGDSPPQRVNPAPARSLMNVAWSPSQYPIYGHAILTGNGFLFGGGLLNRSIGPGVDAAVLQFELGGGAFTDASGTVNYGLNLNANLVKMNIGLGPVALDGGVINIDAGLTLNCSSVSIGAQVNIIDGAVTFGGPHHLLRIGLSAGVGAAARFHFGDTDGNGIREVGFGFDFAFLEFDAKTELIGRLQNKLSGGIQVDRSVWTSVDLFGDGAVGPAQAGYMTARPGQLPSPELEYLARAMLTRFGPR